MKSKSEMRESAKEMINHANSFMVITLNSQADVDTLGHMMAGNPFELIGMAHYLLDKVKERTKKDGEEAIENE